MASLISDLIIDDLICITELWLGLEGGMALWRYAQLAFGVASTKTLGQGWRCGDDD